MPDQSIPQPEKPVQPTPDQEAASFAPADRAPEQSTTPPVAPEAPPSPPESGKEVEIHEEASSVEIQEQPEEGIETLKRKLKKPKKQKPTKVPQVRDELTIRVEKIMEEGLGDAYRELTPVQKQEFKLKGEETAYGIRQLLGATRVKVKSIFKLLVEWLKILPGVNRFFLEQEAKIKADKIMTLHEHYGKRK